MLLRGKNKNLIVIGTVAVWLGILLLAVRPGWPQDESVIACLSWTLADGLDSHFWIEAKRTTPGGTRIQFTIRTPEGTKLLYSYDPNGNLVFRFIKTCTYKDSLLYS